MNMSDNSRFIYIPASALASRKIIEQSSYTTTPGQSSADPTPPCGEMVYQTSLDDEKIRIVDSILAMEQTSDAEAYEPRREEESSDGRNEKSTSKTAIDRASLKKGNKINKNKSHVSEVSINHS